MTVRDMGLHRGPVVVEAVEASAVLGESGSLLVGHAVEDLCLETTAVAVGRNRAPCTNFSAAVDRDQSLLSRP